MKYEFAGDSRLLKEIEVKASRIPEEYTIEYRTKRPYGRPNYVLKAKDINTTYGNLLLSLPSKFPGLVVRQSYNLDESPRWVVYLQKNYVGSLVNQPEVVVTINDTFVGGRPGDILGTIDPNTVESVELRTSVNVMYGAAGMGRGGRGSGFVRPRGQQPGRQRGPLYARWRPDHDCPGHRRGRSGNRRHTA